MNNLKPNEQRAKFAILLLWIVLALEIASLISSILQYNLLQTIANGGYISEQAANANDSRESTIAILLLIAYIVFAITFIMWFRRAYYNLHQKVSNLAHSEGWAAGCWFVPIVSLYLPYQIMKEIYEETKKLINGKNLSKQIDYTTTFVGWWWAFFIISGIIGTIYFRLSRSANTVDELITLTIVDIVTYIIGIPLALLAMKVIRDYSKVEPLLNEINNDEQEIAETLTEKTENDL